MSGVFALLRRTKHIVWSGAAYAIFACLAYLPALLHPSFLCDDFILLARIRHGQSIWNYRDAGFYRPGISVTMDLLWRLFGTNPLPYHIFNVLTLVATGLILRATWRALRTRPESDQSFDLPAFVVGLIFVLWITHSESVSWISGMTDGVAVLFASAALLAFVRYRSNPTGWGFTLTVILLWLGLLCKEAIVTWTPILLLFGFVFFPSRGRWKTRTGETVALLGLSVVYVAWRTHVIGQLIGGYGTATHLDLKWHALSARLSIHLANAFVPFNKMIALWLSSSWVTIFTTVACLGSMTLLLRKIPKSKPTPPWVQAVVAGLILIGFVRMAYIYVPDFMFEEHSDRMFIGGGILLALLAAALYRWRKVVRFETTLEFAVLTCMAMAIHANTVDWYQECYLCIAYLGYAFLTRPVGARSEEDKFLMKIGIASFAATFLAILPAVTLRVGLSGEASRFSYGPSFFSAMTLSSVALLYLKGFRIRLAFAVPALVASGVLLYENNIPWAQASDISNQMVLAIKSVLPARRIYVLSAPGAVSAAIFIRIGIQHVAEFMFDDTKVQIQTAFYEISCVDKDSVTVQRVDPVTFQLGVRNNTSSKRFNLSYLQPAEDELTAGWFSYPLGEVNSLLTQVKLEGFQPTTDRVLIVDGQSARVIR